MGLLWAHFVLWVLYGYVGNMKTPMIDSFFKRKITEISEKESHVQISTATTERSFSRMNIVKNALRNKMEDDFLSNCLVINIEKEIAKIFSTDSIIDDFRDMESRRSLF
ncbi:hypothetical protein QQ045_030251 [Rhodiola kirilowii]